MKKRVRAHGEMKLNMTPMIDVVMLLIVFFLVASKFKSAETDVLSLAYARNTDRMESPDAVSRFVINVRFEDPKTMARTVCTHQGAAYDPTSPAEMGELGDRVRIFRSIYPDGEVLIRADGRVDYRHVRAVHGTCRDVGARKVSFAVNPRPAGEASDEEATEQE